MLLTKFIATLTRELDFPFYMHACSICLTLAHCSENKKGWYLFFKYEVSITNYFKL